ncbi:four-carbon acid sugar kinase family protein [Paraburkholderia phosphatilytica]|uniref:four-carbon acid sugar kinase family protein n=1 Tax=Paraburkholderia phosphatilytica TaxID=2282883 RepID=UPI000E53F7ED|nr:four-carbon acid sugar kinase family protein [Paraburkholderia phosphatilytica]
MADAASASLPPPRLAYYGDDFTGASDTLATLAEAGLRALLFLGVPTAARVAQCGPLDAIGVAGAARSMDPASMRDELRPVARFLASLGAPVVQYKCCSTFDSAPHVGNLAVALEVLGEPLGAPWVGIVGGQPSLGRYCAFGQLFATAGGEAAFRIDRHPTMSRHPVTPMHEADLRAHLQAQGMAEIGLTDFRRYGDAGELQLAGARMLFDVTEAAQLGSIGRALWQKATREQPVLALGASSVAQALIACWRESEICSAASEAASIDAPQGPVLVLCGSQSPVTARQVDASSSVFDYLSFDPERDADAVIETAERVLGDGRHLLIQTTPPVVSGPSGLSPRHAALATGAMLVRLLRRVPSVRRVGIAGGDTSSFAVQALGGWGLQHIGRLGSGVSLVRCLADDDRFDGLELMLKGGQMGDDGLFGRLVGFPEGSPKGSFDR